MPFTSQSIATLLNGVSQQPPVSRHPTQAEAQENCLSDLAAGLRKRPAFRGLDAFNMGTNTFVHFFENTFDNQTDVFAAVFNAGNVQTYRFDGDDITKMTTTESTDTVTWFSGHAAAGVADLLLPLWAATTESINYSITITGTATVVIGTFDADGNADTVLATETSTNTGSFNWTSAEHGMYLGCEVTSYSSGTITVTMDIPAKMYIPNQPTGKLSATTIADYTFVANDRVLPRMSAIADTTTLTGTVQTFGDLPGNTGSPPADGSIYLVEGDSETNFDDYYVLYTTPPGIYSETVEPGGFNTVEDVTMPHVLVRTGETTFEFNMESWNDRIAGDSDSAPEPSFMGKGIKDITFYRDRLGLLAGEGLTLSRVGTAPGGYFAFYPESVQHVLDSDPIDIKATRNAGGDLFSGIPFNENLLLFSNQSQFIMNPSGVLTPETARIDPTTAFAASPNAKPVALGNNVYFAISAGQYAQVREYYVSQDGAVNDAADVTSHVPEYIPSTIYQVAGSTSRDIVAVVSDGEVASIYVYKFYWDGNEKKQASWSKWTLPSNWKVLNLALLDEKMQLAVHDTTASSNYSGMLLEMSFDTDDDVPTANGIPIHLDAVHEVTSKVYSGGSGLTTLTWANCEVAAADFDDFVCVINDDGGATSGTTPTMTRTSATTATIVGDYSGVDNIYVGFKYNQKYTFSEQFVKRDTANEIQSSASGLMGRLQLRRWLVRYGDTNSFKATVTLTGRTAVEYNFDADDIAGGAVAGTVHTGLGSFAIPIIGRSSDLTLTLENDAWTPATWLSAEWVGVSSPRPVRPGRTYTAN